MTIEKWLADVYYDDCGGTQIWSKDEDGGSQLVAEVRGWGAIQNEFKTNEEAEKFQDEVGEFIVQAIREKIARTSSQTEISEPNPQLIESMCYRYRHDFGFLKDNHKESIRTTMKQLWEEVVGKGFYKQKEISDEEIDDVAERYAMDNFSVKAAVKFGIKWYREQLKKKNL